MRRLLPLLFTSLAFAAQHGFLLQWTPRVQPAGVKPIRAQRLYKSTKSCYDLSASYRVLSPSQSSFFDTRYLPNVAYYYWIVTVAIGGQKSAPGNCIMLMHP